MPVATPQPGARELRLSHVINPAHPGDPGPCYARLGFVDTGERIGYPGDLLGYEAVLRLPLRRPRR